MSLKPDVENVNGSLKKIGDDTVENDNEEGEESDEYDEYEDIDDEEERPDKEKEEGGGEGEEGQNNTLTHLLLGNTATVEYNEDEEDVDDDDDDDEVDDDDDEDEYLEDEDEDDSSLSIPSTNLKKRSIDEEEASQPSKKIKVGESKPPGALPSRP